MREVRVEIAAEFDVGLHLIKLEGWLQGVILQSMHIHNVLRNVIVLVIILIIEQQKEYVETGHDWSRDVHVETQGLRAIVSAILRVGSSQDRGPGVQSCMDASLRQ